MENQENFQTPTIPQPTKVPDMSIIPEIPSYTMENNQRNLTL